MSVTVKWHDKEFERKELDPAIVRLLKRIAFRGVSIAKQLISGSPDPELKAVDTGRLRSSLTHEIDERRLIVRIGTNVKYAIFVFLGTFKMQARPVLRRMLAIMKVELR